MPRYSFVINWNDRDSEEGTFAWTGIAKNGTEAEKLAREAMRAHYVETYGGDEEAEQMANDRQDGDDEFGGSVVSESMGAAWDAQALEDALRAVLPYAESRAEDLIEAKEAGMEDPAYPGAADAVAAVNAAKALLASLEG